MMACNLLHVCDLWCIVLVTICLQCFDAVGWVASGLWKTEWWDAGMVMCPGQGADLHMAQLMPLPLNISCFSESRLVLPCWFYLSSPGSPGYSQTKSKRAIKWLCVCVYWLPLSAIYILIFGCWTVSLFVHCQHVHLSRSTLRFIQHGLCYLLHMLTEWYALRCTTW